MRISVCLLVLSLTLPAFSITEGGRDMPRRNPCEELLLANLSDDVTDVEVLARATAAETISMMIMEHPMILRMGAPYADVKESALRDLFHLSMGLIAPVAPVPGFLMPDSTGRLRLISKSTRAFKSISKMVYDLRDPVVFTATTESKRKVLAQFILKSSILSWRSLAKFGGFSNEYSADAPQIRATSPLHVSPEGEISYLKISDLRGPTKRDLQKLNKLIQHLDPDPVEGDGSLFSIDARMALPSRIKKVEIATKATDLIVRFLALELPTVLKAREELYLQATGKSPNKKQSFKVAIEAWFTGVARTQMHDRLNQLARGTYNFDRLEPVLPKQTQIVALPAPTLKDLLQEANQTEGMNSLRAGIRALDLLIEDFPKSKVKFDFLMGVKSEADLRADASTILQKLVEVESQARTAFEKIVSISETTESLSKQITSVLEALELEDTSSSLNSNQEALRKEEIALSQVTFVQSLALIENRMARHQQTLTIVHQLQALVRQYRYQLVLEKSSTELGEQIVMQIQKLTAKDQLP